MKLIIKSPLGVRRTSKSSLGTVEADDLYVGFKAIERRTGRTYGGIGHEVEKVGVDKSTIVLHAKRAESWLDDRGSKFRHPWLAFRLLDRNKYVRVLSEEDATRLAAFDAEIAELQEQIQHERNMRAEAVKRIWTRSEKLPIETLEEKAQATS